MKPFFICIFLCMPNIAMAGYKVSVKSARVESCPFKNANQLLAAFKHGEVKWSRENYTIESEGTITLKNVSIEIDGNFIMESSKKIFIEHSTIKTTGRLEIAAKSLTLRNSNIASDDILIFRGSQEGWDFAHHRQDFSWEKLPPLDFLFLRDNELHAKDAFTRSANSVLFNSALPAKREPSNATALDAK